MILSKARARRQCRVAGVLGGLIAGFLVLTATPALGLPGGSWPQLDLIYRGQNVASAYGTWQGYREDQGRGSRVQDWSAHRMPGVPGWPNTDGAYVKHSWYDNAHRCYLASWSDAGGSIGCSSGWWGHGNTNSIKTKSSSWQYREAWHPADPDADSTRAKIQVCLEIPLGGDECTSASYLRGASYG